MSPPPSSGPPPVLQHGVASAANFLDNFKNLLGLGMRDLTGMTKNYGPAFPYQQDSHVKPADIKKLAMASERIEIMLEKDSGGDLQKKTELVNSVKEILDEIGLDEIMPIIRTLGTILNCVFGRVFSGLHVNETYIVLFGIVCKENPL